MKYTCAEKFNSSVRGWYYIIIASQTRISYKLIASVCCTVCAICVIFAPNVVFANSAQMRVNDVVARLEIGSLTVCEIVDEVGDRSSCFGNIVILDRKSEDAWAKSGDISITKMLVDKSSDDELAFVIAHEFAHVMLGHLGSAIKNELEADHWAAKIMHRSGFDAEAAEVVFGRFQVRRFLSFPFSLFSHPPKSQRMRTIRLAIEEEVFQDADRLNLEKGLASIGPIPGPP